MLDLSIPKKDESAAMVNALTIADLPPEKVQKMKDYANKLAKQGMKPARVTRKVAEKFKVNLI